MRRVLTPFAEPCLYDAADINECAVDNGGCSANAECSNTPAGSRTCKCKTGFEGNGMTCTGEWRSFVVPDALLARPVDAPNDTCQSQVLLGVLDDIAEVDKCATNNGGCSENAKCTNTPGGRTCACRTGFAGNGITCAGE